MVKLSVMQMCSEPNVENNLAYIEQQLSGLKIADEHIVVLPECCLFFGGKDADQLALAKETAPDNSLVAELAAIAKKYQIILVAGSIPLLTEEGDKFTNSCCVFSSTGEQIGRYDKLHLFDVVVDDAEKNYFESRYTQAGKETKVLPVTQNINLGLTICYDLRFPELFRSLTSQGANVITVPSAFTKVTGEAHWQVLLQSRAIENQVYIVAAGQSGTHASGRETWGHSMIISPWGEVLTNLADQNGCATATFSLENLKKVQQSMPVRAHNQFITKLK
ncbi:carbon-nitrogen hydrolase family protein [Thalassotalea piscium]|uniref:Putative amidohydrolase n=1 Tax=Thalassotalea piscium TaxID=1230533 RepID=A0A7X0NI88_9GAMM|nr:carbon-nitrogen hydrolase family protein [Thalassotalea piscium]MBB6543881.1 putative amidohydrolase [Thalassotalea piscium]